MAAAAPGCFTPALPLRPLLPPPRQGGGTLGEALAALGVHHSQIPPPPPARESPRRRSAASAAVPALGLPTAARKRCSRKGLFWGSSFFFFCKGAPRRWEQLCFPWGERAAPRTRRLSRDPRHLLGLSCGCAGSAWGRWGTLISFSLPPGRLRSPPQAAQGCVWPWPPPAPGLSLWLRFGFSSGCAGAGKRPSLASAPWPGSGTWPLLGAAATQVPEPVSALTPPGAPCLLGAVSVRHPRVLLTHLGQIPAIQGLAGLSRGEEEEEGAQFRGEEGEGARKSYGGWGADAWHLPVPRDGYRAGKGQLGA